MERAYSPHGAALADYFRGNEAAMLVCYQDGERGDVPAAFWFRELSDPLELMALDLAQGRVLDLGAGTGLHALELQRRGVDVTALDVSAEAVAIMTERGVEKARLGDLYSFDDAPSIRSSACATASTKSAGSRTCRASWTGCGRF
jgi:SAM-dependent methyltransferase